MGLNSRFLISILVSVLAATTYAQNCSTYNFPASANNNGRVYPTCITLPVQNSFLHWNYHPTNGTVDIAFRHTGVSDTQWVCWALNPDRSGMIGAQCLVAYTTSSGQVDAYTSSVDSYRPSMQRSALSFNVPRITAERVNNEMFIYATLVLPSGRTNFNHLWQIGPVSGDTLRSHQMGSAYTGARGRVDFSNVQTSSRGGGGGGGDDDDDGGDGGDGGSVGGSRFQRKNTHGVLNAVSWGILMPMGAMAARYLKVFKAANPAWFYIHVTCQTSAYIVGVAGWGTGLKLGSEGSDEDTHGNIGLTLFILGTLQVFALLLRPKPDHKYRFYWNIYHHTTGYTVIFLSIFNVFKGLDILDPEQKWKNAYISILVILGVTTVILEALTWVIVLKRRKAEKHSHLGNGTIGINGYGNGVNGYSGSHA